MQQDDVVWQIINNQFCSFKIKTPSSTFCRNEYNVTGLCNKQSCPLANSQYATVREFNGRLYLLKKVVERAHLPSKMWEKILLSQNVEEAKEQIEKNLEYWSQFSIGKCQMRLERIVEVQKRMRKLENSPNQPILLPKKSKKVKRDRNRENRALEVSRLETVIEKELVDRLQQGVYGEIYNFHPKAFETLIKEQGGQGQELEEESEEEYQRLLDEMEEEDDENAFVEALSDDDEEEEEEEYEIESEIEEELEDFDSEDEEMMKDLEDLIQTNKQSSKSAKSVSSGLGGSRKRDRRHVEIEYETEDVLPKRLLRKYKKVMCFGAIYPQANRMEFTESFPITQNGSTSGQLLLSPSSRQIAMSEFHAADRRIGSNAQEVLPAWTVRVVDTDTLATLREFYLKLPTGIVKEESTGRENRESRDLKRQFVMSKSSTKSNASPSCTVTSPRIGSNLIMEWSPDGRFLAAWPQDTSIVFILCPESTGASVCEPLLRIQELSAVGIANYKWTPDSTGLLVNLKYGMGIKYWRLDCKYPVHLFPYPKGVERNGMVFSQDGRHLAILHRRDGVDHIAIYARNEQTEDYRVLQWLNVPEDVNLEGITFARGSSQSQYDQIPQLYAWESISKFQFLLYDGEGNLKCHVTPEIFSDTSNCSFGIRNWRWSETGRIAAFSDSQEVLYLWNAINHKLMGKICLNQLEALKQQNPIVFREQPMRESNFVKYEASYTFPLQSQIVTSSTSNSTEELRYELSFDGEFLAVHHPIKYSNCVWVFDLKGFRLKALLVQMKPIQDFIWHPTRNVLTVAIGSEHVYFWQPDGTHCIPYPHHQEEDQQQEQFLIKSLKWMKNQRTILMNGNDNFCLGLPEIL